jgi:hypothetical protein
MLTTIGYVLSGILAVAVAVMGGRYLLDPLPAAAGFGIPGKFGESDPASAWLAVKGSRDIALAIAIAITIANGAAVLLGWLLVALALIPLADGTIVLRSGGPKAIAYGVHWATAAVMLIIAVLLFA